jgi:hypothetical protein
MEWSKDLDDIRVGIGTDYSQLHVCCGKLSQNRIDSGKQPDSGKFPLHPPPEFLREMGKLPKRNLMVFQNLLCIQASEIF